jgi:hypothetical protein
MAKAIAAIAARRPIMGVVDAAVESVSCGLNVPGD